MVLYSRVALAMAMVILPRVLSARVLGQAVTQVKVDHRSESTFVDIVAQQSSTTRSCLGLEKNTKLGVLFLNLGGPEKLQDVEGFLYNLFADPDIIRLPRYLSLFQKPLAWFIAKTRGPKSSKAYESIGGGSPIVKYTREQSRLVEDALRQKGFAQVRCYFAMRYWYPFTEEVLRRVQDDGVEQLVVVPLYPHYSVSTSGSSLKLLKEIFEKHPDNWGPSKVRHTVVASWYQRPGYLRAMAGLLVQRLARFSEEEMTEGVHVLFSAHGVPESYIRDGDPYQRHIEDCVARVLVEAARQLRDPATRPGNMTAQTAQRLAGALGLDSTSASSSSTAGVLGAVKGLFQSTDSAAGQQAAAGTGDVRPVQFHLSYQSKVGPVQWLKPYTDVYIRQLAEEKQVRNLVAVPISFVSEHIETLEEIDLEYWELALECGVRHWERVPALNTEPGFIADLADLVVDALHKPTLTVAEATSQHYSETVLLAPQSVAATMVSPPQ